MYIGVIASEAVCVSEEVSGLRVVGPLSIKTDVRKPQSHFAFICGNCMSESGLYFWGASK